MTNSKTKILYIISWNYSTTDGVSKKTIQQVEYWSNLENVKVIWLTHNKKSGDQLLDTFPHIDIRPYFIRANFFKYAKLYKEILQFGPDVIYTRYPFFHPFLFFLSFTKKMIYEINTLERKELALKEHGFNNFVIKSLVTGTRDFYLRRSLACFMVTNELRDHPDYSIVRNKFCVPNSIDLRHFRSLKEAGSDQINIFFSGTPGHQWHGLDKIKQLAERTPEFSYHIAGLAGENQQNVTYYGRLGQVGLHEVMSKCHICIGSLSLNVLGLKEACPLKVREYIACGFPVVLGYKDAAFIETSPSWVFYLEGNFENIDQFRIFCIENRNFIVSEEEKSHYVSLERFEEKRLKAITMSIGNAKVAG